ncbi:hypothetical protein [Rhodohalobacter sp. 8-1]|uniref:hypothetical protein n=1 Tax=Rhodohalobacter sp. 8-1 TaxID=3131972 RepID=UPI0030EE9941
MGKILFVLQESSWVDDKICGQLLRTYSKNRILLLQILLYAINYNGLIRMTHSLGSKVAAWVYQLFVNIVLMSRRPTPQLNHCHSELNGVFPFDEESVKATYFVLSNKINDWFYLLNNSNGLMRLHEKLYLQDFCHQPTKVPVETHFPNI